MQCLYCGNPNPYISIPSAKSKSKGLSEKIDMSYSYDYNVSAPPIVDCRYCGRCYELIANGEENRKFLKIQAEEALNHIPDEKLEHFATVFANYGISVNELLSGVYSIVIPNSNYNRVKRYISKKLKMVIFETGCMQDEKI